MPHQWPTAECKGCFLLIDCPLKVKASLLMSFLVSLILYIREKLNSTKTADGDCSHEIKRRLLLGRKVMANLDSIFKSRDITLPTKVCLVKAMVFPAVMYGCENWTIKKAAAAAAKSLQSCLTLCDPIDGSPPGSPIPGNLQARTLEWVAISFSNAWKWKAKVSTKELMLLSCDVGEDSWESFGLQGDPTSPS